MSSPSLVRTALASPSGDGGGPPLSDRGWRITQLVLHVVFAVLVGLAFVDSVIEEDGARLAVLLVALAVLVLVYVAVGAPGLASRNHRRLAVYLFVLVAVIGVLAWVLPELLFLMFLAFPQAWFMASSLRAGIAWTLALGVAGTAGPLVHVAQGSEPLHGPAQTLVGVVFSLAMGVWVTSVLENSAQRASLIQELESTRAELAALHHQQGMVAERERLAREVHDTLAQGYTSIVVLAQTAAAALPGDPVIAAERLGVIEEVARENLGEARAMVAAFAPVALDSATLVEALERLAERFGRETGIATRLDTLALDGVDTGLSRSEEIVLLRGAQEALANVRRHASASAVVLRVSRVGSQVSMHVEDDGVGFDPAASPGVGLAGLRDRAEEVGGVVDVASAPGEGTRVTVRVPAR